MKNNPYDNHKDIPGNPSTAKSSTIKLNDRSNNIPLKLLSEDDWDYWIKNGYIIIKNAISKKEAFETADFLWEFENKKKDDITLITKLFTLITSKPSFPINKII